MIPKPYATFFKSLDPLIALWGASLFLLSPSTVTSSYLPPQPLDPSTTHPASFSSQQAYSLPLHGQIAGHLLSNALLSIFLLRATDSLKIWRIYQLGLLIVDVFLLYGTFSSYAVQGRLNPTSWRLEDWGSVGITGGVGIARLSFLLGLGFPTTKSA
ncbi:hypothetical protein CPLU01_12899 [Colletotrichum plurivorum]|uniref:DUF7704 domain-containing protein n=1 Tax=Colletotrichum plurivorum TaxID=2175906 RepID=A0A8H6N4B2_9PEZI|nr:hypothetical protein CPLU01_12899 [Colletotrichum plurivorum]